MVYDWQGEAQKEGGERAPRVPAGEHDLEVTRIITSNRDGVAYESKSGDPQIMLILADARARECLMFITLSLKGAWVLAKLFQAGAVDVSALAETEPSAFADQQAADDWIRGIRFRGRVEWETNAQGKHNSRVTILGPLGGGAVSKPAPPGAQRQPTGQYVPEQGDEIPFA